MIGDKPVTTKAANVVMDVTDIAETALLNAYDKRRAPASGACMNASYRTKISSAPEGKVKSKKKMFGQK